MVIDGYKASYKISKPIKAQQANIWSQIHIYISVLKTESFIFSTQGEHTLSEYVIGKKRKSENMPPNNLVVPHNGAIFL